MFMMLSSEKKQAVEYMHSTILLKLVAHTLPHTCICIVICIYVHGNVSICIGKSLKLHVYQIFKSISQAVKVKYQKSRVAFPYDFN